MMYGYRTYSKKKITFSVKKSALLVLVYGIFTSLLSSNTFSETRMVESGLPSFGVAPSQYAGFVRLLDDESMLVPEELLDLNPDIKRIAFYHNGDRLHRSISKQVHLMIENKLLSLIHI